MSNQGDTIDFTESEEFKKMVSPATITGLKLQRKLRPSVRELFPEKTKTQVSGIVGALLGFEAGKRQPTQGGLIQEFFILLFEETIKAGKPPDEPEPPSEPDDDEDDDGGGSPIQTKYRMVWGVFLCTVSEVCVVHVDQFNNVDNIWVFSSLEYLRRYHAIYYPSHTIFNVWTLGFELLDSDKVVMDRYDNWLTENQDIIDELCEDVSYQPRGFNV